MKRRSGLAGAPALRRGLHEVTCDLGDQTVVLLQAEHEVHVVRLAPAHQLVARKARVGTQQDAGSRPACPDAHDKARHFFNRPGCRIQIGAPQRGHQQVAAAEHVERQIAVAIVIAVEEPSFLLAMQRIIRCIEVENDLPWRTRMRLEEQIDKQLADRRRIVADLVIARRFELAQLQPVERRFPGHRGTFLAPRRELARQHRHHRIVAQLIMIVEILVAQRDRIHPLADQRPHRVLDQLRTARVAKARRKSIHHSDRSIRCSQQQRSGVRRHQAAIKRSFHRAPFDNSKVNAFCATLRPHRGSPRIIRKSLLHNHFR